MLRDFVKDVIGAFSKVKEEIEEEKRGELDFRYSLADYLLKKVLGWGRKKGEGHFVIREREDILLFDDNNRCVALIETKNPKDELTDKDRSELKDHLDDFKGIAKYGALTNGHEFQLFEYTSAGELNELVSINIDAFIQKGVESLTKTERQKIYLLRRLEKNRFVGVVDPEYFRKTVQEIRVEDPEKFELFIQELRASLDELTEIMERFFRFYQKAGPTHYGGKLLREEIFPRWKGASVGREEELREKFCRETAYVLLNRILFTRILEDKEIIPRMISGKEFAQSLVMFGESAYEMVLKLAYENVEKFYEHFYEFGIFDWWRLSEERRGILSDEDLRVQKELERDLNVVVIRNILRRLNRFNFRGVNRDILGDVYQEYLPPAERKRLGEFYTPVEVVRYILDAVGYTPKNRIEDKLLLDPACGSGTFLVEAAKRLIKRYEEKLKYPFQPDNARAIIEGMINNIHGLDINPFACHIAEMNLLFNIMDYLHAVHRKYRDYRLPRFNICCTDSLVPPEMETPPITEYFKTNGRIRAHMEEEKRAMGIKKKKFDFVVGNPPYVRTHYMKETKKRLRKLYPDVAKKQFDLFIVFIKCGAAMLREGGSLGFIVSNKLLANDYAQSLRKFLLQNCLVHQIVDASEVENFFTGAVYPIILVFSIPRGGMSQKEILSNIISFAQVKREGELDAHIFGKSTLKFYGVPQEVFLSFENTIIPTMLTEENLRLVKKMENIPRLREKWRVDRASPTSKSIMKKEREKTLTSSFVKALSNENIHKYYAKWDGVSFIDKIKVKKDLSKSRERILMRKLCSEITAAYDDQGFGCVNTVYLITPHDEEGRQLLKYVVGVLNSKIIDFYSKIMFFSTHMGGKFLELRTSQIEQLPIKIPQTSKERQLADEITWKVDTISKHGKELNQLEEKVKKFPESYFSGEKLVNVAEECKLSKERYDTKSLALEPVKKAGKELYKLTLTRDDYILFSSRAVAECALGQLKRKNKVRIDEVHKLKVPHEKDASRIIDELSSDKKRVEEIRKEIEKLEREVDELVYELYGLDAKDREAIEEFLKKF